MNKFKQADASNSWYYSKLNFTKAKLGTRSGNLCMAGQAEQMYTSCTIIREQSVVLNTNAEGDIPLQHQILHLIKAKTSLVAIDSFLVAAT